MSRSTGRSTASPVSTGAQPSSSRLAMRRSRDSSSGVSTFRRRDDGSLLVRPMRKCCTSNRPLYSTTLSKMFSMIWESIRWPSASTTSWNGIETSIVAGKAMSTPGREAEQRSQRTMPSSRAGFVANPFIHDLHKGVELLSGFHLDGFDMPESFLGGLGIGLLGLGEFLEKAG